MTISIMNRSERRNFTEYELSTVMSPFRESNAILSRNSITDMMWLLKFCLPVIVLFGTVGNILSFAVLIRRSMRSTPMYFYLMLLAVADTMVLYTSAFKTWIRVMTGYEALHVSDVGCKIITFLLLNSLYMSAWLIVLVTLDRFFVVWFPFRGYLMTRIRQSRIVAAVLTIIIVLFNSHVFWTYGLQIEYEITANGTRQIDIVKLNCDWDDRSVFSEDVFLYLKLTLYCIVPFGIVLALNVSIIVRLRQSNQLLSQSESDASWRSGDVTFVRGGSESTMIPMRERLSADSFIKMNSKIPSRPSELSRDSKGMKCSATRASCLIGNDTNADNKGFRGLDSSVTVVADFRSDSSVKVRHDHVDTSNRQRRLTRMLLCVSLSWLALTAPFALHVIVFDFIAVSSQPSIKIACFLLVYVNHASNFYLYCITGKRFRRELRTMFRLV